MKKVMFVVALLVIGLMAFEAQADIVKLLKVSGTTSPYIGSPKTLLPSTAYVTFGYDAVADAFDSWVVYYWTEGGQKWFSGPWQSAMLPWGNVARWTVGFTASRVWVNLGNPADPIGNRVASVTWGLIGTGTGLGGIPSSMTGMINQQPGGFGDGVMSLVSGDFIGGGFGTARANAYKTLDSAAATAAFAAVDITTELLGKGYQDASAIVTP